MLSFNLRCALEKEVVGQTRAINTLLRTVTVALSGLGNPESPLGIYLLVGPSGTGKTHMARSLARLLHGDPRRLAVVDCLQIGGRDDWPALTRQMAPHFQFAGGPEEGVLSMPPLSIVLVEHLEWARPELVQALVSALETGYLMLPDGKCGSLNGALVLMTSNLCAKEIYDAGRQEIGFSPAAEDLEETEKARIYQLVATAAEKQWGADFLCHLDDLIVFHRLREGHLPFILKCLALQLNRQLAPRQITCQIEPRAAAYLLGRAARYLRHGAWILVKVFRRFVVFPVADLAHGGRAPAGSRILVDVDAEATDRLRFSVDGGGSEPPRVIAEMDRPFGVPVRWEDERASILSGRDS